MNKIYLNNSRDGMQRNRQNTKINYTEYHNPGFSQNFRYEIA